MKVILVFFLLIANASFSQLDSIVFSHNSGYYSSPISLLITGPRDKKIYYSTDGNNPSTLFLDSLVIRSTQTVRVRIEGDKSDITRNYLFTKHSLPVVFLTMRPGDLFDTISGMYVKGPGANPDPPYRGANFHKNWERVANIELLGADFDSEFNQQVGVRIFGQYSAMLPQKSFSIHAKSKYGKKKIKAKVFDNLEFKKYKSLILRNSGSDFCSSHFRDVFMTSLVRDLNIETQAYRSCVVYLNGEYWGIYHLREKLNEHYLQQHFEVDKDSVAILKHRGDVQEFGRMNYKSLIRFIERTDFSKNENIDSLGKLMDIDNYLDYNIAQVYFNNIDAGGNIRYWRSRKKGSKWRWILFDTDFGFGLRSRDSYESNTIDDYFIKSTRKWPYPAWSTVIIRKLMENEGVKQTYLRKVTNYLNWQLSEKNVTQQIERFEKSLAPEIPMHYKKWRRSVGIWNKNVASMREFGAKRPTYLRNYIREFFDIDSVYQLSVDSVENGSLVLNGLSYSNKWRGVFFSNITYDVFAKPSFGYHFSHWKSDTNYRQAGYTFTLDKDRNVTPVFAKNKRSNYSDTIRFNEVCKNDSIYGNYVELVNTAGIEIDLSGWHIVNEKNEHYKVPEGVIIKPKEFVVFYSKNPSGELNEGLFNIKSSTVLKLYSDKEELVEELALSKKLFNKKEIIEKVSSFIRTGWIASEVGSPGFKNERQISSEKENKYILIGFVVAIVLLFLFVILHNRRTRLRGATE